MHNAYMEKNAAVTLRLPMTLKKRLAARAKRHHRSLSAQAIRDLERVLDGAQEGGEGRFLGLYEGGPVPSDEEIQEVRALLWGTLGRRLTSDG